MTYRKLDGRNDNVYNVSPKIFRAAEVHDRWHDIRRLTERSSDFAHPQFRPGEQNLKSLEICRLLVVGAGGLGCELLKNLVLSGFRKIDIIDMDRIELSNLNRQFLFREKDIGRYKSEVAAAFVNDRVTGCNITPHNCKIQDKAENFYRSFDIVICGLDSIVARRWLNAMLVGLVEWDCSGKPKGIIPFIDGGTEGFKGNARVIFPSATPCVECSVDLYPPQVNFPLCTIAQVPRLPEHCIEYVKEILWQKEEPFGDVALDADNGDHLEWAFSAAKARAGSFGIHGVDLRLTKGVLKRIIPAVASTNAVIAASCALEAFKLASNVACPLTNYLNFTNSEMVFIGTLELEKDPMCSVCGAIAKYIDSDENQILQNFIEIIKEKFKFRNPSVQTNSAKIYMRNELIPELDQISVQNLSKCLKDLGISDGDELLIVDETRSKPVSVRIRFCMGVRAQS